MIENDALFRSNTVGEAISFLQGAGRKKPLSIRELSRRLGYASDRTLGMAHTGARPMSHEMLEKLSAHFRLSEKQTKFLRLLNDGAKLKSSDAKKAEGPDAERVDRIAAELSKLRTTMDIYDVLTDADLKQIEAWYAIPILAFITRNGPATEAEIQAGFEGKISSRELHQALSAHAKLGRIEKVVAPTGAATYRDAKPSRFITSRPDIPSRNVRRIHASQLDRAKQTLDEQGVLDREFMTFSIAIDPAQLPELKKRIRDAIIDLTVQLTAPETVARPEIYQLGCQFYRQTRHLPAK